MVTPHYEASSTSPGTRQGAGRERCQGGEADKEAEENAHLLVFDLTDGQLSGMKGEEVREFYLSNSRGQSTSPVLFRLRLVQKERRDNESTQIGIPFERRKKAA